LHHYSRRLLWNFHANSLSDQARERRTSGQAINDLTRSNPTECFEDYPHEEIGRAFAELKSFRYNPEPLGAESARYAVCTYYKSRGIHMTPDRLILTASTSEAYALLFKLLCDPGDEILVPTPSYPLFEFLADLESVRSKSYQMEFDGAWYLDFNRLHNQITDRTRALVVVNPNNPTGSFLKQNEFEVLLNVAGKQRMPIISDEVFLDYGFGADSDRVTTFIESDAVLSFSLNGLSKAAGMPQMKLGWIAINGPVEERARARERLELIADTYLSVGTPVQYALPRLFEIGEKIRRSIAGRTRTNLSKLYQILQDSAAQVLRCEGGWSAIVRLPATQSEESWTLRLLNECGVLVQPGYFFDMASEPYIVVSLITAPEEFEQGIAQIHNLAMSH